MITENETDRYFLVYPARGSAYHALIDFVASLSETFEMTIEVGSSDERLVESMQPYLLRAEPTHQLDASSKGVGSLEKRTYAISDESVGRLHTLAGGIEEWGMPGRPGTLMFWRPDGTWIMGSLRRRPPAHLILSGQEANVIKNMLPTGALFHCSIHEEGPIDADWDAYHDRAEEELDQALRQFDSEYDSEG